MFSGRDETNSDVLDTYRIPSRGCWEAFRAAARIAARDHVIQRCCPPRVEEGIEEPERTPPRIQELIVEHRYDARECRCGRARPDGEFVPSVHLDHVVHALSGDVGDRTAAGVEPRRVLVAEYLEVPFHCLVLVRRPGEDVGEPSGGERGGGLRAEAFGASDSRDATEDPINGTANETNRSTYNGQLAGKVGTNSRSVQLAGLLKKVPATPLSPEANKTDVPLAPSCAYMSQSLLIQRVSRVSRRT